MKLSFQVVSVTLCELADCHPLSCCFSPSCLPWLLLFLCFVVRLFWLKLSGTKGAVDIQVALLGLVFDTRMLRGRWQCSRGRRWFLIILEVAWPCSPALTLQTKD